MTPAAAVGPVTVFPTVEDRLTSLEKRMASVEKGEKPPIDFSVHPKK